MKEGNGGRKQKMKTKDENSGMDQDRTGKERNVKKRAGGYPGLYSGSGEVMGAWKKETRQKICVCAGTDILLGKGGVGRNSTQQRQ